VVPSPDHGGNIYFADNPGRWVFTLESLIGWGIEDFPPRCRQTTVVSNKEYTVKYTIKELAENPRFGPGEYVFRVGGGLDLFGCGCTQLEKRVVIFKCNLEMKDLSEEDEETNGRIVLLNNDYDEANENPAGTKVGDHMADHSAGDRIVEGDKEVQDAKLVLNGANLSGKWKLTFPGKVKIWEDKGSGNFDELTSGTESDEISLPITIKLRIEGVEVSTGYKDVELRAGFIPTGETSVLDEEDKIKLTVAQVELEPVTLSNPAFPLYNPSAIEKNQTATYEIRALPVGIPDSDLKWSKKSGGLSIQGSNEGRTVQVKGTSTGSGKLEVQIENFINQKPTVEMRVIDKKTVKVFPYIVTKDDGTGAAWTSAQISSFIDQVNDIYVQIAVEFNLQSSQEVRKTAWLDISEANNWKEAYDLCAHASGTGGLEFYFVSSIDGANGLSVGKKGIIVASPAGANFRTIAHEIGHACGLSDIYVTDKSSPPNYLPDAFVKPSWAPSDWNDGEGPLYYSPTLDQKDMIRRLLMYGVGSNSKADIPKGKIYGYKNSGSSRVTAMVEVGLSDMDRTPKHD
jgi:hypothetical protein